MSIIKRAIFINLSCLSAFLNKIRSSSINILVTGDSCITLSDLFFLSSDNDKLIKTIYLTFYLTSIRGLLTLNLIISIFCLFCFYFVVYVFSARLRRIILIFLNKYFNFLSLYQQWRCACCLIVICYCSASLWISVKQVSFFFK